MSIKLPSVSEHNSKTGCWHLQVRGELVRQPCFPGLWRVWRVLPGAAMSSLWRQVQDGLAPWHLHGKALPQLNYRHELQLHMSGSYTSTLKPYYFNYNYSVMSVFVLCKHKLMILISFVHSRTVSARPTGRGSVRCQSMTGQLCQPSSLRMC